MPTSGIIRKCLLLLILLSGVYSYASDRGNFVTFSKTANGFPLAAGSEIASILTDSEDKGILRAVNDLRNDIQMVTGKKPVLGQSTSSIIIGTAGNSPLIDRLISEKKIDGESLSGKYEKYIITTIESPQDGIETALVIAGSDKRGTIYGIYELSAQIGVSPWYYWADVPVKKNNEVYIQSGTYTAGEPAVRYRGIFLNDEAPALTGWVNENFGGYNHRFYEKVFELLLRLKGNYMWPAMWDAAFYDDDPQNSVLANEMGIVMGTSHHEPMARAHKEWKRYGQGAWNYQTNKNTLDSFWQKGIERMKHTEDIVTIGMRGDGDEPMSEKYNIALLEQIVKNQRNIIAKTIGKKADQTPQLWALYKEVQDYYDHGMRVPDDVTLLLCDDNWGNVRKLPDLNSPKRAGGYGMYYHFDYVGGPRNYKWLNVSPVQRIWEQMNLTYEYGVDRLWIVNVGDLKPMEYPISFFLDMAWNPNRFNADNLLDHIEQWCAVQFGNQYAKDIARLINLYTKYNRRVTPELLNEKIYSLHNYNEFRNVTDEYNNLLAEAFKINYMLPVEYRNAYDQLVLFPIQACANLYEMYYAVAMNHDLFEKNDIEANQWANKAEALFERDSLLTYHYNKEISGGKWNHMMDQTHIGYTSWQQPDRNIMPQVFRVKETDQENRPIFKETDGYIAIEAENYTRAINGNGVAWQVIPHMGKTLSAVTTMPVTVTPTDNMVLEYEIEVETAGEVTLSVLLSPTLNFNANKGLRYAISIDGQDEQIVNFNGIYTEREHEARLAASINESKTKHVIDKPGKHTIRFRALDPGIVLQKLILDMGGLKPSFLGAPESPRIM
ncbi:glycosyl hydrolase 115 family protein [Dysgonomonas macrotermitis]|uniref:Glycosyl hydrolase family 67 N-terminus n=1 Tax=Dysgonomonas macrotermitis TaxID=1346286 RepID=A0A1M4SKU7_9BACT|nr:glycosyl hydrolase 115 family protein [Dysgonomonas macrotermitis]SHE32782.1 Glycosyl hydrolase family 67 N-terminus [Dysgonomonas macrotermitis]